MSNFNNLIILEVRDKKRNKRENVVVYNKNKWVSGNKPFELGFVLILDTITMNVIRIRWSFKGRIEL